VIAEVDADEPIDVCPTEFQEPVIESRKATKPGEKPHSVQDVFDYFGVGDEKPAKTIQPGRSQNSATIQNRRERQPRDSGGLGKKLGLAALLLVPLLGIGGMLFAYVGSADDGADDGLVASEPPTRVDLVPAASRLNSKPASVAPADASRGSEWQPAPAANNSEEPKALAAATIQKEPPKRPASVEDTPPTPRDGARAVVSQPPTDKPDQSDEADASGKPAAVVGHAPEAASVIVQAKPVDVLRYKWKPGDKHVYSVKVTAGEGRAIRTLSGTCTYSVLGQDRVNGEESKSSGTGFVVAANGYIATCAHVVEDAKRVDVTLGKKVYEATVVAENRKRDIALLKINATGLHVLPHANSDEVRLAEPVRAFGFPLSSMLGTGLKVASGEVAGTVDHKKHGRQIQTDAPINPGNSGGPMINDRGQVIGVASSKLINSVASSVGFAVPINALKEMLAKQGIPIPGVGENKKLDGPTLAEQVTPGVAFIKVRSSSVGKVFALNYQGRFAQSALLGFSRDSGRMQVNVHGQVTSFTGKGSLPYVLGSVAELVMEELAEFGDPEWGGESVGSLSVVKRERSGFPRIPGFGGFRRGFPGRFGNRAEPKEEVVKTIPAIQRVGYRLGKETDGRVTIHKTYEFITTDDEVNPYFLTKGKSEIVFDRNAGQLVSVDYTANVVTNDEDGRTETPISVKVNQRDAAEVARERAEAIARAEELRKQKELERTVPDPERVDAELDALATLGRRPAWTVLQKLAPLAVVPEKREAVLNAARPYLKDSNDLTASSAAKILAKWATEDDVDELRTIMAIRHHMYRDAKKEAIRKLLKFKDVRSFAAIIKLTNDGLMRRELKPLLIDYGPKIEQSILNEFDGINDMFARMTLVEVLAEIGTEDSLPLLEGLVNQPHVKTKANRAIQAIRRRIPR
jgi:S1-C subfamily serine protease